MTTLLITTKNESLAKLQAYSSNQTWVNLKVSNLKSKDQDLVKTMLDLVAPDYQPENFSDIQVASIKYTDGQFQRCYPISCYAFENSLAIKLGRDIVKLDLSKVEAEIEMFEVEKYEDPCLVLTQELEDGELNIFPLPLRINDQGWEANKADNKAFIKKLNLALKKGNHKPILDLLLEATVGGSGERLELVDIRTLPFMEPISVTAVKEVETKFGMSYVLTIVRPADNTSVQIWCPNNVKSYFALGSQLSATSTLTYSLYVNKAGKELVNAQITDLIVPVSESDADFADLF
jgi:hypothetical protein